MLVSLVAGLLGAAAGWAIADARQPSNEELRAAARALTPPIAEIRHEQLIDRPASLANPPWDLPGSRLASVTFSVPPGTPEEQLLAALAARARAGGWSAVGRTEADERNRLVRFRRRGIEAAVELERGEASAIRVRPRAHLIRTAALGFLIAAAASAAVAIALGRTRRA